MITFNNILSPTDVHEVDGPPSDCISTVRFSPSGCPYLLLGAASWDKTCRVWQVIHQPNGMNIRSQPMTFAVSDAPILDMSFSADGRVFWGGCSKTATMWNLTTNQKIIVGSHDLPVSCIAHVSSNTGTEMLITGSWDGRLRFWDLRQPLPIKEEILGEPVFGLDAQRSFPMAACVTGRKVHIFNLQTMMKTDELKPPPLLMFNLRCVACSPQKDGVVVGSSEGRLSFIPLQAQVGCTFKAHVLVEGNVLYMHQTNFCVISPRVPHMISGGGDGRLSCWDYKKRSLVGYGEFETILEKRNKSISAGDISTDGSLLAFARSYDWAMGKTGCIPNEPHSIHIRSAEWKPTLS
ncbi:poly(A) export protein, putative [Trypanosoma cruzi marinkellei]|uniref:Poly(A) export protein, putative n=1 Tax=Trypanosoma cruzi marinkellei TaxID=85056 RepID=K2NTT6_TRYCR|nr:poly(A) export protein, putative [Trypanosoma cruzi marinkellei]